MRRPGARWIGLLAVGVLGPVLPPAGPVPARAQSAAPDWTAGVGFEATGFTPDRAPWSAWTGQRAWLERSVAGGSIRGELFRARRFDRVETGVVGDAWADLWPGGYANLRIAISPEARTGPAWDVRAEAYQTVARGWEASLSGRRLGWSGDAAGEYGLTLGQYVAAWYLRERVTLAVGPDGRGGPRLEAIARWSFRGPGDLLEVAVDAGDRLAVAGEGPAIERVDGRSVRARFQAFPWPRLGFAAEARGTALTGLPDRRSAAVSLLTRW